MVKRKIGNFVLALLLFVPIISAQVTSPEQFLGFKVGADKKLADMYQIIEYFQMLDDQSDRITVKEIGKTTEGNPFIVAIITSENNQKDLVKYQKFQQLLADPRQISDEEAERMIGEGKAIVMVNCSLHASEIGASQMSMELGYDLATKNDPLTEEILDNVILLLTPMHNPDGIQMVVDWYNKNVGTKYEGGRMPWLYHKYVGHDNNRDWYMFTQVESQLTLKVHNAWHPQVIVDMHQMGSRGARLFVPPYVDPYEPNVDPILRQQVAMMGTFIASELTAQGKAGVAHSIGFDAWTPARAYHHYHGGIRILTEAASARVATSITVRQEDLSESAREPSVKMPLPWKGGEWRLRDIVEYDYAAVKAALTNAAGLRENWLRNFYRIHKKAVNRTDPPYAFIIPIDQRDLSTAVKMLNVLKLGAVEIHKTSNVFTAEGREFPAGSFIVYIAQPYGGFAKTLLERQVYPEIRETPGGPLKTPYDVVGHTLPLLMEVDVVQADKPFQVETVLLDEIKTPKGKLEAVESAYYYAWGHATNDDIVALNRLAAKGHDIFWTAENFEANGKKYPQGTMIVKNRDGLLEDIGSIIQDLWVRFEGLWAEPKVKTYALKEPRVGLYKSWTASMDEGWTRWVLEQYEVPFKSVFDKDIRKGNLNGIFDVVIIPDLRESAIVNGMSDTDAPPEYAGGIGVVGIENLIAFVKNGGTVITLNGGADFAIKHFHLGVENSISGLNRREFFIPGSILKALNDTTHPIAYGFERDAALFYRRSPAFTVHEGRGVVRYPTETLLSGWATGDKHLINKSAIVDVPYGEGKVILIGFPVVYRGQSHGTFRYLFNAIYYGVRPT
ncbi:MAG: hypothetical protein JSV17_08660 [Candidatus Aminicenantes bacterium]|nr:MAG: hypothetical protein JSV17_08660 [Candidatus Aminicenantes bacterium]